MISRDNFDLRSQDQSPREVLRQEQPTSASRGQGIRSIVPALVKPGAPSITKVTPPWNRRFAIAGMRALRMLVSVRRRCVDVGQPDAFRANAAGDYETAFMAFHEEDDEHLRRG